MLPLHAVSLLLSLSPSLCVSVYLSFSRTRTFTISGIWFRGIAYECEIYTDMYIFTQLLYRILCNHSCVCVCCSGNKNVELSMRQSDNITSRWNWWCFVIIITLSTNFKRDTDTLIHSLTHWFQFTSMNWHEDSKQCCLSVCALFSKLQVDRWQNFILFKWCHHKIDDTADIVVITDTNCFNCTMKFS